MQGIRRMVLHGFSSDAETLEPVPAVAQVPHPLHAIQCSATECTNGCRLSMVSANPWHIELVEPALSSDLFVVPAQPLLNSSCSQSWTLESLWALYVPQTHHLSYARGSRQRLPPLRLR